MTELHFTIVSYMTAVYRRLIGEPNLRARQSNVLSMKDVHAHPPISHRGGPAFDIRAVRGSDEFGVSGDPRTQRFHENQCKSWRCSGFSAKQLAMGAAQGENGS